MCSAFPCRTLRVRVGGHETELSPELFAPRRIGILKLHKLPCLTRAILSHVRGSRALIANIHFAGICEEGAHDSRDMAA